MCGPAGIPLILLIAHLVEDIAGEGAVGAPEEAELLIDLSGELGLESVGDVVRI